MERQTLFLDLDCVLADFCDSPSFKEGRRVNNSPPEMFERFFFENLPPVDGALSAVRSLLQFSGVSLERRRKLKGCRKTKNSYKRL